MNFRYDINGLRAIAVIAVVLFHFNPAWFPGGFAGVDVFFVISGFLMTGIIFKGLMNDNFNLFDFYIARANRIIPVLIVLCLVLLVFGWFYLPPFGYRELGKHVSSSLVFFSNVIYWRESGYFDVASHEKWLLHTWSLSVEWQFYILYPIVLVALKKFLSLENLKRLIFFGTVLSFCLSVIAAVNWPNPAYYLLPTRAWEMMMGGVAFLYPWNLSESKKKLIEIIGLALILGSYIFVSSDVPWPGLFALFPVLGSYLIIVSNQQTSLITNNAPFQYLGKFSYSIYIWHWPVVVYLYFYELHGYEVFGIFLSIVLGFSSYYFVESKKIPFKVTIYLWFLVTSISTLIIFNSNFIDYPESILGHYINDNGKANYIGLRHDHLINTNHVEDIDFIGIGDSNLVHLSFGIKNSASVKVLLSGAGSCLTFPDYTRKPYAPWMNENWLQRCSSIYKRVLNSSKDVIWSQSWGGAEVICTSKNCKTGRPKEDYYSV
uniref:acyltransferase family protein n=1 Tax=Vibrio rotiferianus TaxID=190895 RepID=UPI0024934655